MDSENKPTEKKDQKQYDAATLFDGLQVASIKYWISSCITGQFWINLKKKLWFRQELAKSGGRIGGADGFYRPG